MNVFARFFLRMIHHVCFHHHVQWNVSQEFHSLLVKKMPFKWSWEKKKLYGGVYMCIHVALSVPLPVRIIRERILTRLMTSWINVQPLYGPEQILNTHTDTHTLIHTVYHGFKGHNIPCDVITSITWCWLTWTVTAPGSACYLNRAEMKEKRIITPINDMKAESRAGFGPVCTWKVHVFNSDTNTKCFGEIAKSAKTLRYTEAHMFPHLTFCFSSSSGVESKHLHQMNMCECLIAIHLDMKCIYYRLLPWHYKYRHGHADTSVHHILLASKSHFGGRLAIQHTAQLKCSRMNGCSTVILQREGDKDASARLVVPKNQTTFTVHMFAMYSLNVCWLHPVTYN